MGFVMTIYRRRLASSFRALSRTLEKHLEAISAEDPAQLEGLDEDVPDDELTEYPDPAELEALQVEALAAEEEADIHGLLHSIGRLPPDSKLEGLKSALDKIRQDGYSQAMVFTQYTDTMDFLREELHKGADSRLMCFSGRGGEVPSADGTWRRITRDDAKRRFLEGEAGRPSMH